MAYAVMACVVMACVAIACMVMAHTVTSIPANSTGRTEEPENSVALPT